MNCVSCYGFVVLTFAFSYFLSSIPFSFLIPKLLRNIDIRTVGSGNVGATNVYRACGIKLAILAFLLDGLKGLIPVLIAKYIGLKDIALVFVSFFAIIGHTFPIYLKFKGGKGVATSLFVLAGLDYKIAALCLLVWAVVFAITKISSLSAISAGILLPIFTFALHGVSVLFWFTFTLSVFVIYKHKSNIARLIAKSEKKL